MHALFLLAFQMLTYYYVCYVENLHTNVMPQTKSLFNCSTVTHC